MNREMFFTETPRIKRSQLASPLVELATVVFLVLITEWAVIPLFGKGSMMGLIPAGSALFVMLLSHRVRRESPRDLGFRIDNFGSSLILLAPLAAASVIFLIVVGLLCGSLRLHTISPGMNITRVFAGLFIWGLFQQYALQAFINRRVQAIWGSGTASILLTAGIFALMHLPNFWLTIATFFGGLMWAWAYQRVPNLFALGISHALMTIALVLTVPYAKLHGLRVGYGYFHI